MKRTTEINIYFYMNSFSRGIEQFPVIIQVHLTDLFPCETTCFPDVFFGYLFHCPGIVQQFQDGITYFLRTCSDLSVDAVLDYLG